MRTPFPLRASVLLGVAAALGCTLNRPPSAADRTAGEVFVVDAGPAGGNGAGGGASPVADAGASGGATVGSGEPPGEDGGFSLSFVALGDTGRGNVGQAQVGLAIANWCEAHPCELAVLLGDNIYDTGVTGTSDPLWQTHFELPYAAVNLPFYAVLGNHDYGAGGAGYEFNKAQFEVDYSNVSTKWRMPATHYRLRRPGVDFFAANTNLSMFGVDNAVRTDFGRWLPASTATWKIALGHHPYLSNGPHGNAGSYDGVPFLPITNGEGVRRFLDERVCGRADVYLSGHDHSQQWVTERCGATADHPGTELIVSGAGAASTTLRTSGAGFNPTHFQSLALGFLYVEIVNRTFTGTFVGADGSVLFTRTFTK